MAQLVAAVAPQVAPVAAPASAQNTTEIRNWARENGIDIKDRGRVPADVVAKYQAATGK